MLRFLLLLLLVGVGGGALWAIKYLPNSPSLSFAAPAMPAVSPKFSQVAAETDAVVAQGIRDLAEGKWQLPQMPSASSVTEASLSASVAVTPKELWTAFREKGSQAVVDTVIDSAEVSVNSISTKAMNEARYQYCLGVVEQYNQSSRQ